MDQQLTPSIKIAEQGENAYIIYVNPSNKTQQILFNNSGIYFNGTNITAYMPLSYSSAFQTATLSSAFQQTGLLAFANIANYSFTSTVNGASTTIAIKTA
jgi:hypothetical protein